jgi:uncharacterized protein (DUF1684 family)
MSQPGAYEREIQDWRERRVARLREPWSWLSLVDRQSLAHGPNEIGPGTFTLAADGTVSFTPRPGVPLPPGRVTAAQPILFEGRRYELLERGGATWIRVRDPNAETRTSFPGIRYFPVDARWRIVARWEGYAKPKEIRHDYEEGPPGDTQTIPGRAHFEIEGHALSLEPVIEDSGRRLHVLFGDRTNREPDGSYPAGRFLYTDLPQGNELVLDFNKAFNPPCAFTDYAACPLTPLEHRLAVAIPAGEKRPA